MPKSRKSYYEEMFLKMGIKSNAKNINNFEKFSLLRHVDYTTIPEVNISKEERDYAGME